MKKDAKQFYEKMVDFKRFAVSLLAVGSFFYLGVIIPADSKSLMDIYLMVASSYSFLLVSIFFFLLSKRFRAKLIEMEEGQKFLTKNK